MIGWVILAMLVLGAAAFWLFWRRKKQMSPEKTGETNGNIPLKDTIPMPEKIEGYSTEIDENVKASADGLQYDAACAQTIGSREQQEDSCWLSNWKNARELEQFGLAAVVADGIGGIEDGQLASQTAVQTISECFARDNVQASLSDRLLGMAAAAQRAVLALHQGSRCGSTLISVLIQNHMMELVSIGDSRIYLCRQRSLLLLNRAHVLGKEKDEESALALCKIEADNRKRKALTAYLGKENLRQIDRTIHPMRLISGDRVLMMSDGVFEVLTEDEILACVQPGAAQTARRIIQSVVEKKVHGQDNATVAVIEVK